MSAVFCCAFLLGRGFLFRCGVGELGDSAAGDGPEVEAGGGAVGGVAAVVFGEAGGIDGAVAVEHTQAALDSEIAVAEDIGALEAEGQQHFCCPSADAAQGDQLLNEGLVIKSDECVQIELAGADFMGEIQDVIGFAEADA